MRFGSGCLLAGCRKLEKIRFPQLAVFTGLPSRDSLGVYHANSRLLGQFETFGACWAGG